MINGYTMKTIEVAKLLSVARGTVLCMAARGELPKPIRVGGTFRFNRELIEEYLYKKMEGTEGGGSGSQRSQRIAASCA